MTRDLLVVGILEDLGMRASRFAAIMALTVDPIKLETGLRPNSAGESLYITLKDCGYLVSQLSTLEKLRSYGRG